MRGGKGRRCAFTLEEVVMAVSVASITIGSTISGYVLVARRADWATMSGAADMLAMQRVEQIKAARWDTVAYPAIDEIVTNNFPDASTTLDLPISGTNTLKATLKSTITTVSSDPPLKMIQVACVWPYMGKGYYTNTVTTYRSPDQ